MINLCGESKSDYHILLTSQDFLTQNCHFVFANNGSRIGQNLDVTVTKDGYATTKVAADVAAKYSNY